MRTKFSKGTAIVLSIGLIIVPLTMVAGKTDILLFYFLIQTLVLMFHTHEVDEDNPVIVTSDYHGEDINELIGFIEEKRDSLHMNDIIKYEKLLRIYRSNSDKYNRTELIKFITYLKRFYAL